MITPPMHFVTLRTKINDHLLELETQDCLEQAIEYPWLFGALGTTETDTMFICENPSLTKVRICEDDQGFDTQWGGGLAKDFSKTRFRKLLVEFGLKEGTVDSQGGWRCYITNLVKEANIVNHQRAKTLAERRAQAEDWSGILRWEIDQVQPKRLIAVGGASHGHLKRLQGNGLIPPIPLFLMSHYSQRKLTRTEDEVLNKMRGELSAALAG